MMYNVFIFLVNILVVAPIKLCIILILVIPMALGLLGGYGVETMDIMELIKDFKINA